MFISSALRGLTHSPFIQFKSVCELDLLRTNVARTLNLTCSYSGIHDLNKNTNEKPAEEPIKMPPLDKEKARALIMKLSEEERELISAALKEFEANKRKEQYSEQLAAFKWRSKFGRPTRVRLGDVDPTGSYCPVPEDWLMKKYAETVPKPTKRQLARVLVHNAIPFVGFGFLDNSTMILCVDPAQLNDEELRKVEERLDKLKSEPRSLSVSAVDMIHLLNYNYWANKCLGYESKCLFRGNIPLTFLYILFSTVSSVTVVLNILKVKKEKGDYIEMKVGALITISTMAAAALGNCFSDVLGLGSAYYVERLALALGFKAPNLSPLQMSMTSTRRASNLGRAIGVVIGCILGMSPLLIL